ncbi:hypothetical protein KCP77_11920 [Salmonella enterica subsp. enterica]|nr:hypothetical protein KCP77_11920 [Salmonella enterica subsp. enterica]
MLDALPNNTARRTASRHDIQKSAAFAGPVFPDSWVLSAGQPRLPASGLKTLSPHA